MSYWKWWYKRCKEFVILSILIISVFSGLAFSMYFKSEIPIIIGSIIGFGLFFGTIAKESYKHYKNHVVR